ncbi:unnamed protein product [Pleuronectes platessa]|uniref:Uncharacterized protein n=1 Tax=Pleuronectes platessa TaxID=8262 RepID=A0A9N7VQE8_PLEPL|nr:unnamed protein product [Pleuronectes platessa]
MRGGRERDSNEELRHHSLLPGLFKGLSSGVRTSGWVGQRRKKEEEDDRGGDGGAPRGTMGRCRRDGTGRQNLRCENLDQQQKWHGSVSQPTPPPPPPPPPPLSLRLPVPVITWYHLRLTCTSHSLPLSLTHSDNPLQEGWKGKLSYKAAWQHFRARALNGCHHAPPPPECLPCPTDTTRCSHPPKNHFKQPTPSKLAVSQPGSQPGSQQGSQSASRPSAST